MQRVCHQHIQSNVLLENPVQELETLITFQVVEGEGIGQQLAFWVASFPGSSQLFVAYCTVCEKKAFL